MHDRSKYCKPNDNDYWSATRDPRVATRTQFLVLKTDLKHFSLSFVLRHLRRIRTCAVVQLKRYSITAELGRVALLLLIAIQLDNRKRCWEHQTLMPDFFIEFVIKLLSTVNWSHHGLLSVYEKLARHVCYCVYGLFTVLRQPVMSVCLSVCLTVCRLKWDHISRWLKSGLIRLLYDVT